MANQKLLENLPQAVTEAVKVYWATRERQSQRQKATGVVDQGLRSAVTGGAQMNGFVQLITNLVLEAGVDRACVHYNESLELPGYFRPTKRWDLVVVVDGRLIAALEAKSQVGPSFGNNFNNRTEEAMGSALDLWTAFREQAFWFRPSALGLGTCSFSKIALVSTSPVAVKEPHFKVFPESGPFFLCPALRTVLPPARSRKALRLLRPFSCRIPKKRFEWRLFRTRFWDLTFQTFANSLVARVATFTRVASNNYEEVLRETVVGQHIHLTNSRPCIGSCRATPATCPSFPTRIRSSRPTSPPIGR